MIKIIFSVDLAMVLGSSAVAYDYIKQSGQSRDLVLEWDEYVATVQLRAINLMEPQPKKRISSLPQIAKAMTTTSMRTMVVIQRQRKNKSLNSQRESRNCKPWSNGHELYQGKAGGRVFARRLRMIIANRETIDWQASKNVIFQSHGLALIHPRWKA
jgi:hypothetical protein